MLFVNCVLQSSSTKIILGNQEIGQNQSNGSIETWLHESLSNFVE